MIVTVLPRPPNAPALVATDLRMNCEEKRIGPGLGRHVTVVGYGDLRRADPPLQTGSSSIRFEAVRGLEPHFKNHPTTFGLKMVAEWNYSAEWDQSEPAVLPRLELRYFDPADGLIKTATCGGDIVLPSNPKPRQAESKPNDRKQPEIKPIHPGYWSLPAFFVLSSVALLTLVRGRPSIAVAPRRVSGLRDDLRRLIGEAGIPESWYREDHTDLGHAYRELVEQLGRADASAPVDARLAAAWERLVAALERRLS